MNGEDKKKVQFLTTFKAHADLKLRLQYDDLRMKEFFNAVIDGYVNGHEGFQLFIDEVIEKKQVSKTKRQKARKAQKKASETKTQFALSEGEIENIFDIIEKENPEL